MSMLAVLPCTQGDQCSPKEPPQARVWTVVKEFIGLVLPASGGLLDTGAQHGVIGKPSLERLETELGKHGLKVRRVPQVLTGASGIGGSTEFLETIEVPIGLGGVSGTVTLNVVSQDAPLLLPQYLNKMLGMVLSLPEQKAEWTYINSKSDITTLPTHHLLIDIMEYPKKGVEEST